MRHSTLKSTLCCALLSLLCSQGTQAAYDKVGQEALQERLTAKQEKVLDIKERREIVAQLRPLATAVKLPQNIMDNISPEGMYPKVHLAGTEYSIFKTPQPWRYYLSCEDGLVVALISNSLNARLEHGVNFPVDELFLDCWRYDAEKADLAFTPNKKEKSELNPITGEAYFSLPSELLTKLDEPEKIKSMQRILSQNLAAMLSLTRFNKEAFMSGDLFGKLLFYPQLRFGEQKEKALQGGCDEQEIKLHEQLGFLLDDVLQLCKDDSLTLKPEEEPIPPVWYRMVGMRRHSLFTQENLDNRLMNKGSVPCYCINSCKDYSQSMEYFLREQLKENLKSMLLMQEGLAAIAKEAGVKAGQKGDASKLSAEQQILLGWCNTMDYYILRLKSRRLDMISTPELLPLQSLAPYVGKEHPDAVSSADKKEAEEMELKLDKKRESWRKRVKIEEAKREKMESKKLLRSDNEWAKAHGFKIFKRGGGATSISR